MFFYFCITLNPNQTLVSCAHKNIEVGPRNRNEERLCTIGNMLDIKGELGINGNWMSVCESFKIFVVGSKLLDHN